MLIGAIEAGGTKFVCGIGREDGIILDRVTFPTGDPATTIEKVIHYFKAQPVEAIGVGSFGPINLDSNSPQYGYITTTPKLEWTNYPLLNTLRKEFNIPFGFDTDVNAAAYGESIWGAAKGLDSCAYFTIGTGIGMGLYVEGKLVHGLMHPEGGHLMVRRHPDDPFKGNCPYHGDCLEGLAAGPAIEMRWNMKGHELQVQHPAWKMEAYYIGQAVATVITMISPKKVILGGGVMQQKQLFPMIRNEVQHILNGYLNVDVIINGLDDYIVSPGLGDNAGLCGSLALGLAAAQTNN